MIHVVIGDGKGKTTSAVGLTIRAAGHGFSVLFMQFLKNDQSGEISILKTIDGVTVKHSPVHYGFTFQMTPEQLMETAEEYAKLVDFAKSSKADMIVLDEVLHALSAGLVKKEQLESLLVTEQEIVLTGHEAPEWLIHRADYVTQVQKVKHPFDLGVLGRLGIEY